MKLHPGIKDLVGGCYRMYSIYDEKNFYIKLFWNRKAVTTCYIKILITAATHQDNAEWNDTRKQEHAHGGEYTE